MTPRHDGVSRPTLRTARIELVPLTDDHLELEVQLDSDPEVLPYLYDKARTARGRRIPSAADGRGRKGTRTRILGRDRKRRIRRVVDPATAARARPADRD
jgi:RimJ/RimL family protein N-acetyltransferase